jgi:hypothetical protein
MNKDLEHEQSVVMPSCPPEHYVGVDAAILNFSIKVAAAVE